MTPVFPEGQATFDSHHKTLKLLGMSYKMGDVIFASGYVDTYDSEKLKLIVIFQTKSVLQNI